MFRGSVPSPLRSIIHEHARQWDCEDVYIGCSGNFTIERTLASLNVGFRLHGNDVTFYSCAIGESLAGRPFPLVVRDEYRESWGWLEDWASTPEQVIATVLLASRMLVAPHREDHPYYRRIREAFKARWVDLHSTTLRKVTQDPTKLASYFSGDVQRLILEAPTDRSAFVCFPPFYAGDFESQFRHLTAVFDWPEPEYEELDQDGVTRIFEVASERFPRWIIGSHVRRPSLDDRLRGRVQTSNRGVAIWVYSSPAHPRVVVPKQDIAPVLVPRLGPKDELTPDSVVTLAPLTAPQFQTLRSLYMNAHIRPGSATVMLGLLIDGKLAGVFAYSLAPTFAQYPGLPGPHAYLLSDFPVSGTRYRRLAKLVVHAALSYEAHMLCERAASHRFRSLTTTAFSSNPVSMKYRGVLDLVSRKDRGDGEGTAHDQQRYELNYSSLFPRWSLRDGYLLWLRKHS